MFNALNIAWMPRLGCTCKTVGAVSSGATEWGPGAAAVVLWLASSTRAGTRGSASGSLCVRATGDDERPSGMLLMPLAPVAEAGMDTCSDDHRDISCMLFKLLAMHVSIWYLADQRVPTRQSHPISC